MPFLIQCTMELRGGGRFFYIWGQQALISHLSGCPKPHSKDTHYISLIWDLQGPKLAQIFQKWPKSYFEHSGGRLE